MGRSLADIAQQQQAADISRMQFQQQVGGTQQEQQQQMINQAIQNYAMAQQYPQQQLAAYNALLRGYQTPVTTVSQYQAAPSPISQLSGLGLTTAAAYGLSQGKKAGGKIEEGIDVLALENVKKKVAA
jgi:type II secretory pathway pseudopilin PulG